MQIITRDFVAGARAATGIAVIIDVFRAFSLAAHAFAGGVRAMYPVADLDDARLLKHQLPHALLLGERHAMPPADFDGGNSPALLSRWDLRDREIIHTTHAGTQGLMNATQADEVITGALVNAAAIVRYIQQRQPATVTLVRMGYEARTRCEEDDLCAEVLAARLSTAPADIEYTTESIRARLRPAAAAAKFFDPACAAYAPQADFELCTQLDRFDFVLRLAPRQHPPRLLRIEC